MEELIVEYLQKEYAIECSSQVEIKICKDAVVRLLNGERSSGENMGFPFVVLEPNKRAIGYNHNHGRELIIRFSELCEQQSEDDIGDMFDIM